MGSGRSVTPRAMAVTLATVLLLGSGCSTPRQPPIALSAQALQAGGGRIGVAMTALPRVDVHLPGTGCTACAIAATAANAPLLLHAATLPADELASLRDEAAALLRKKGLQAVVIDEPIVAAHLPPRGITQAFKPQRDRQALPDRDTLRKLIRIDLSAVQDKHQLDRLLLIDITELGFMRSYSTLVPLGAPRAVLRGSVYLVDLEAAALQAYQPIELLQEAQARWDEPPRYPGLSLAFFQALELARDSLLAPLAEPAGAAPLVQAAPAVRAGPLPAAFALQLPLQEDVLFRGADGPAGAALDALPPPPADIDALPVALVMRGLLDLRENHQRRRGQQAAADAWRPYGDALDGFVHAELVDSALAEPAAPQGPRRIEPADLQPGDWVVESAPVFTLAPGATGLVLENLVEIRRHGVPGTVLPRTVFKVVSSPRDVPDPAGHWSARQGQQLREEGARLFAHSLRVAFDEALRPPLQPDGARKTYRYHEGSRERMERGSLLATHCRRIVIRNLRDWVVSVPTAPAPAAGCDDPLLPPRSAAAGGPAATIP